eukprot:753117-Hanusia_phi.AAC.1
MVCKDHVLPQSAIYGIRLVRCNEDTGSKEVKREWERASEWGREGREGGEESGDRTEENEKRQNEKRAWQRSPYLCRAFLKLLSLLTPCRLKDCLTRQASTTTERMSAS